MFCLLGTIDEIEVLGDCKEIEIKLYNFWKDNLKVKNIKKYYLIIFRLVLLMFKIK